MSILTNRVPLSREKRLSTVSAYAGQAAALLQEFGGPEVDQRIRTFSQSAPDDLLYVLDVLAGIRSAVTIIHGPRGCAASQLHLLHARACPDPDRGRWLVTNLDQRDTIMGADAKLRAAVAAVHYRYRPQVVFIVATPAVAINNDDIQSVVDELSEELGTRIVPIFASGFTSKAAVYGYDLALHGLVKYLAKPRIDEGGALAPPEDVAGASKDPAVGFERGEHVNLLATVESAPERAEAVRLLAALGLTVQTLTSGATLETYAHATRARLSIPLHFDHSNYLGEALQAVANVPFLTAPRPVGLLGTRQWLQAIGAAAGKEAEAHALHVREAATLARVLQEAPLQGVRVYLSTDPASAPGLLELIRELGGEVAGLSVTHLDRLHLTGLEKFLAGAPALPIHVGHGQGFEELNLLQRVKPDLYIGASGQIVQVARAGIPSVLLSRVPVVGYCGVTAFAQQAAKALGNRAFARLLASAGSTPYSAAWYQRSAGWHIKQEVK